MTNNWSELKTFCLFVGYARSGHSVIGSMIDAHPNAVISHELNAIKRYAAGIGCDDLFEEIFLLSQEQARAGRTSSKADGGVYDQSIEGQLKAGRAGITVIGDKNGAATTVQLERNGVQQLDDFKNEIGLDLKILHVMRNPFDIVAAGMARSGSRFPDLVPVVAKVRESRDVNEWLDVYYEDLLGNPREEVARIIRFLGLAVIPEHVERCATHLQAAPVPRRFDVTWPDGARAQVQQLIDRYPFWNRYEWNT